MQNLTGNMCQTTYLQDNIFPYISGVMFGLLASCSFAAAVLVIVRRNQIRNAFLRSLFFMLLMAASGSHVGIGLVHAILGLFLGDTVYNRLQNTYFLTLSLAINVVNCLLLQSAPSRSYWRRFGIVFVVLGVVAAAVHLGVIIFYPNLWTMRIVWVVEDFMGLFALICSIQAASQAHSHVRELALLTAAAATFVLRCIPEIAIALYIIASEDRLKAQVKCKFEKADSFFLLFVDISGSTAILCMKCFWKYFPLFWCCRFCGPAKTCCSARFMPRCCFVVLFLCKDVFC
jgi:hypothetical protein